ncbi:transposase [Paenibacillus wynnii]|nr:transposase [Paenibacillus wynnii]
MGFSYTKPTYTLARADLDKQKAFKEEIFPALKKVLNHEIDHLLFEDELMILDYQALQYNWFLKEKQRKIKTHGQHRGAKLLVTLNYETGQILCHEAENYDMLTFESFLKRVLQTYPKGKIVMILDNARIHHANHIQCFLKEHPRLTFVFLPPYSPELNMVGGLWKWLRSDVINNVFFGKFYYIRTHVREFTRRLNRSSLEVIDRLCVKF